MNTFQTLQNDYKQAFKDRDTLAKSALSYVLSQLKNKAIELGREPNDDEVTKVIQKEVKILKETAMSYKNQGYQNQYEEENQKIMILEQYLPQMLTESELRDIIAAKQQELQLADEDIPKNKGRLIGVIMKEYGATVDGGMLNRLVSGR